jgi:Tol biopolymer transport system component
MKRIVLLALVVLLAACTTPGRPAENTPTPSLPTQTAGPTAVLVDTAVPTAVEPTDVVPATAAAPSPAPSPQVAGELVVYAQDDTLWAYDGQETRMLSTGGPAYAPLLSPDGQRVVYRRPETPTELSTDPFSLWLLDLETEEETAVDLTVLPPYSFEFEGRNLGLPRWPRQIAWLPDGETLLFNTWVDFSAIGPGRLLSDDLWQGDAATGAVRLLSPEKEPPASFTLSPDGNWLLLNRPTRIEALELGTGVRRTLLEFPMVLTYSEYNWLPEPHWLPSGRTAYVAIAPADPMQAATFGLWQLDVEAGVAEQFDQVEGMVYARSPDGRSWSPDGTRLAFVSSAAEEPQVAVMAIGRGAEAFADAVSLGETIPRILGWSPDGQTVLVQEGEELYGVQAGPGVRSWQLLTVGAPPAQLWYGLGEVVLVTTGEGQVFHVTADGAGVRELGDR